MSASQPFLAVVTLAAGPPSIIAIMWASGFFILDNQDLQRVVHDSRGISRTQAGRPDPTTDYSDKTETAKCRQRISNKPASLCRVDRVTS